MTEPKMTPAEEYEFYADPANQTPQGPGRRRRGRLTEVVPVRFEPDKLEEVRRRAEAEDRTVSNWIRRAVDHELSTEAG
ncbi:MAG: CopG family transcriptional regulator [Actinomycetota bacterium]|nr:CopG family transcriptional regulator [Actinomycetota bacterium]